MRPTGEVSAALLQAARDLWTPEKAGTLAELAERAGVAKQAARWAIKNMVTWEKLCIVRERKIEARNKPVAEYAPPDLVAKAERQAWDDGLSRACSMWVQR